MIVNVRRLCKSCGRNYTYVSTRGSVLDNDPGCPDCEPENHDNIEVEDD